MKKAIIYLATTSTGQFLYRTLELEPDARVKNQQGFGLYYLPGFLGVKTELEFDELGTVITDMRVINLQIQKSSLIMQHEAQAIAQSNVNRATEARSRRSGGLNLNIAAPAIIEEQPAAVAPAQVQEEVPEENNV